MTYALVIDAQVVTVGRLPDTARRLDTGQWISGLRTYGSDEQRALCGWFQVVNDQPPFDEATEVLERRGVIVVDGVPTVEYVVRPKTAEELAADAAAAADEADREQARQAITNLRAYADAASPTNAQTVAVVKLLCRVCIRLIRDTFR